MLTIIDLYILFLFKLIIMQKFIEKDTTTHQEYPIVYYKNKNIEKCFPWCKPVLVTAK
jgi:hypothetical protein